MRSSVLQWLRCSVVLCATALACGSPGGPHLDAAVVDDYDYLREGQRRLALYHDRYYQETPQFHRWPGVEAAVRVEVRSNQSGGFFSESFTSVFGSGSLIASSGLVLTAGHVLDDVDQAAEIIVQFQSGKRVTGELIHARFERFEARAYDLGLIRIPATPVARGVTFTPDGSEDHEIYIAAGYPQGLAFSADGALSGADLLKTFYPICVALKRVAGSREAFEVVAGAVPLGGMSGAPILAPDGRCVGVFVRLEQTFNADGSSTTRVMSSVGVAELLDGLDRTESGLAPSGN